jgi:hypothetical protein
MASTASERLESCNTRRPTFLRAEFNWMVGKRLRFDACAGTSIVVVPGCSLYVIVAAS